MPSLNGTIGELRQLRAKLQADGERIKRDIQKYETLSQQVMQLTKIISDSVATLSKKPLIADVMYKKPHTGRPA